jgi:hypothetical protein
MSFSGASMKYTKSWWDSENCPLKIIGWPHTVTFTDPKSMPKQDRVKILRLIDRGSLTIVKKEEAMLIEKLKQANVLIQTLLTFLNTSAGLLPPAVWSIWEASLRRMVPFDSAQQFIDI